jgi:peptidyl-prolyl cis-trans isomerase A (cyclophilin A)
MRAIVIVTWLALACGSTASEPEKAAPAAAAPAPAPAPAAKAPPAPVQPTELPATHNPMLMDPKLATEKAPATYKVEFATTRGNFTVEVHRDWAPNGADRFYNLVRGDYYDGVRFFRAVRNFMVQFGISGYPAVNTVWRESRIKDDPVKESNTRGRITFATSGADSRTTQVFVNLKDNGNLDGMGFAPFGEVVSGMDIVDQIYMDYGDAPPRGRGPNQGKLQQVGNVYLDQEFPKLDGVSEARIVE